MKKKKTILIVLVVLVVIALAGVAGTSISKAVYRNNHIFVEDAVYEKKAARLDLRGTGVSLQHIQQVRSQLPDCEVIWELPFQGGFVPHDATELSVTSLTEEDVILLDHLEALKTVDATQCTDYDQILALVNRRPECEISYQITLNGEIYTPETKELSFADADGEELLQMLRYLPELETVTIDAPTMPAEELLAVTAEYPDVAFFWNVEVLGTVYPSDTTAIDLSHTPLEGIGELEAGLAYLPDLETLELHHCGLDYDLLAEYRERQKDHYKVVWTVRMDYFDYVRTDATTFMPVTSFHSNIWDGNIGNLKYCNEMVCVDVGHYPITHCDWAANMPNLKYLILADTAIKSLEGIRGLENLIYLEIFSTPLEDISPLATLPNLKDLNMANCRGDVAVLEQITSLERLWWSGYPVCTISQEDQQRLQEAIPDCEFKFNIMNPTSLGWRKGKLYYEMRDVLGMPYFGQ